MVRPEAQPGSASLTMSRYPPGRAALLWDTQNVAFDALARTSTLTWKLRYED